MQLSYAQLAQHGNSVILRARGRRGW